MPNVPAGASQPWHHAVALSLLGPALTCLHQALVTAGELWVARARNPESWLHVNFHSQVWLGPARQAACLENSILGDD